MSTLAFDNQRHFVNYVEMEVVPVLKEVSNILIKIMNEDMLKNILINPCKNLHYQRRAPRIVQAVHLIGKVPCTTTFKLLFVPFQTKRNFEIYTIFPELEDGFSHGKEYTVEDYINK